MKTIYLVLLFASIFSNYCFSQVITDYPFKTFLDDNNNLFVTGDKYNSQSNSIDILIEKYDNEGTQYWSKYYYNPLGSDKGIDLSIDHNGDVLICGFVFNIFTNSNDIITIKLNGNTGDTIWARKYLSNLDDKALGISVDINNDVYISGYVTNSFTEKDFIVKKYFRNGDSLWQSTFPFPGDQVATDILLDAGYAYVVGYTYAEGDNKSDIMIQSYDKLYGGLHDNHVFLKPGTDEKPTGFCIPFPSGDPISKSRSAVTSITDSYGNNTSRRSSYFTICFDPDLNNDLMPRWSRTIDAGSLSQVNIPTAITNDISGDLYVTGYMRNPRTGIYGDRGLDFATVKYRGGTGDPGWEKGNIIFNNYNDTSTTGVDDKATSVKVNDKKRIYIAGTSEGSPNGYSIAAIDQAGHNPNPYSYERYKKSFIPNFLNESRSAAYLNKWAALELTSDGTPIMIVMGWNETESHWAAVKFDQSGNVEYTINNDPVTSGNSIAKNSKTPKLISIKNYPNPFNPTTNLEFGISELGFVSLKVYDIMGREIATLVNETKNAGSHNVKLDGTRLSSGVYYYTISVDGTRLETKSMVLMK